MLLIQLSLIKSTALAAVALVRYFLYEMVKQYYSLFQKYHKNISHTNFCVVDILQSSGVKVSQVLYKNIKGTSATQAAMTFRCSPSNPCNGIRLQDIKLTYVNTLKRPTVAYCENARGSSTGAVFPRSCW